MSDDAKCRAMCIATDGTYLTDCELPLGHEDAHSDGVMVWDDDDIVMMRA